MPISLYNNKMKQVYSSPPFIQITTHRETEGMEQNATICHNDALRQLYTYPDL